NQDESNDDIHLKSDTASDLSKSDIQPNKNLENILRAIRTLDE
ncbi:6806_t:CDS:1, partial [Scutellospora calospora]